MVSTQINSAAVSSPMPTAAYLHIPFCRRRCYYCDFPISVVGDRPPLAKQSSSADGFGTIAEYVEILCQEIRATAALGPPLQTIFLGGGTPSLLTVPQLEQVVDTLQQQFGIATHAEISMEIDPDTVDQPRLQGYQAAGISRISLGVQAFQSELLAACGRTHTPADIEAAVELIDQIGLINFSFDLISGLPHQTLEHWQQSLEAAIALQPQHISVYDLTVEAGTAFDRWYQPGVQPLPTEKMTAQMYRIAQQTLTKAGYQHYEVSNYAKPGFQCRHNRVYWENRPYYGFGMGAASYTQGQRFTRPRKRREYYQWVQGYKTQGRIDAPVTPPQEALLDTLMLGLRLAEGLSLKTLALQFGEQVVEQILMTVVPYIQSGWVELVDAQGLSSSDLSIVTIRVGDLRMRLTDPEGFLFSNRVLAELFNRLAEPVSSK